MNEYEKYGKANLHNSAMLLLDVQRSMSQTMPSLRWGHGESQLSLHTVLFPLLEGLFIGRFLPIFTDFSDFLGRILCRVVIRHACMLLFEYSVGRIFNKIEDCNRQHAIGKN